MTHTQDFRKKNVYRKIYMCTHVRERERERWGEYIRKNTSIQALITIP